MPEQTIAEWLGWGRDRLVPSETASLDAELLLGLCLNLDRGALLAHPERRVSSNAEDTYRKNIRKRAAGYPFAYLSGRKEFYGRDFMVTPDVLVPRPETEVLVDTALACLDDGDALVDCGTGSGCIAVTVACERPDVTVHAADVSEPALSVARTNAERLGGGVRFFLSDLLPDFNYDPRFTVVAANLPYVTDDDYASLTDLRHEPEIALRGGEDGLDVIRELITVLASWPELPKALVLEIDPAQAGKLVELLPDAEFRKDLSGKSRIALIRTGVRRA